MNPGPHDGPDGFNPAHSEHCPPSHGHYQQQQTRLPPLGRSPIEEMTVGQTMYYPPSNFSEPRVAAFQYSATPVTHPYDDQNPQDYEMRSEQGQSSVSNMYGSIHSHFPTSGPPLSGTSTVHGADNLPGDNFAPSPNMSSHPSPTGSNARRHSTSDIGSYKTFATGPLLGRTVRAEIQEIQKADLGRKCADPPSSSNTNARGRDRDRDRNGSGEGQEETKNVRKDRRPLDPPPVVALRLFESLNHGTSHQTEQEIPADDIEIGGLICQVDVFKVTIPPSPRELENMGMGMGWSTGHTAGPSMGPQPQMYRPHPTHQDGNYGRAPAPYPHTHAPQLHPQQQPYSPYESHAFTYPPQRAVVSNGEGLLLTEDDDPRTPLSGTVIGGHGRPAWDSSASPISPTSPYTFNPHGDFARGVAGPSGASTAIDPDALPLPSESDILTHVLFGESYAHACSILDLQGNPSIFFVFADLSVKLEGLFRPRYRFFDLFSRLDGEQDVPVLAECFGGCFAVYSTKEFPGLKRSTPLTKHLSRWGIRVNIRETERKRRNAKTAANDDDDNDTGETTPKRSSGGKKGKNRVGPSSSGAEDVEPDGSQPIPRGVDAPRRYLEGATRGKKRTRGSGKSQPTDSGRP